MNTVNYNFALTRANNVTTGTFQFMSNEFQRVMDSILKDFPFTNCYIDDVLLASKGSLNELNTLFLKILKILDSKIVAVKWKKCAFFQKDRE